MRILLYSLKGFHSVLLFLVYGICCNNLYAISLCPSICSRTDIYGFLPGGIQNCSCTQHLCQCGTCWNYASINGEEHIIGYNSGSDGTCTFGVNCVDCQQKDGVSLNLTSSTNISSSITSSTTTTPTTMTTTTSSSSSSTVESRSSSSNSSSSSRSSSGSGSISSGSGSGSEGVLLSSRKKTTNDTNIFARDTSSNNLAGTPNNLAGTPNNLAGTPNNLVGTPNNLAVEVDEKRAISFSPPTTSNHESAALPASDTTNGKYLPTIVPAENNQEDYSSADFVVIGVGCTILLLGSSVLIYSLVTLRVKTPTTLDRHSSEDMVDILAVEAKFQRYRTMATPFRTGSYVEGIVSIEDGNLWKEQAQSDSSGLSPREIEL